ncbi:DapH/DapD/GlmU-related protein [Paludibacter jiangxiensis]|uniref:Acetyltransferase,isoleucine patch superfamily n=1 Tax=Paludibacter jiangxiensis TaxID=681398 RepID=A0A161M641_9BACT|nr:DapH/DapD/GlmU-related protein [Paludibacter jiangxiensis]GAT64043.1 acetyltransferase,isoleucine patch superfamily [Paludibacter jiangxiensis]
METNNLYQRLSSGEPLNMYDPDFAPAIADMVTSRRILQKINNEFHELDELPTLFAELLGEPFQEGTAIMSPFYIDFGSQLKLGKRVFINHNCTCMTAGTIIIEDGVMIGPQVTLLTANHDLNDHNVLVCKTIHIKNNAWIGARATILPGITIGENSVVAGGAVVTKDVEPNVVVGGNPARVLKRLN